MTGSTNREDSALDRSWSTALPIGDDSDNASGRQKGRRPRWMLVVLVVLIVFLLGLVATIVALAAQGHGDQGTSSTPTEIEATIAPTPPLSVSTRSPSGALSLSSALPTMLPSISPTYRPTVSPSEYDMLLHVADQVAGSVALEDWSTPEYRALQWLQQTEEYAYENQQEATQRYALVVADLSLHQSETPSLAVAGVHACLWPGVGCNNATMIEKLLWSNMTLTGSIPESIGALVTLKHLDLGENRLQGSLPESLFDLTRLEQLHLHSNRLTGTLSEKFERLLGLESVLLGDNRLHGPFPSGLGSVGSAARPLRRLSLYKNQLTGPIPEGLNLRQLFFLDLGYNRLNGPFREEWVYSMPRLANLYLDHNQLTGTIPGNVTWLGNSRIEQLVLADNQFRGLFDASFNQNKGDFLQTLHIQHNNFTSIDSDICRRMVWKGGWLTSYRADCEICQCPFFCKDCY